MASALSTIGEGFKQSLLMAYEVWWALVLGFAISAIVQSWVPRHRIEAALAGRGVRPLAWATGLGAASSSCSYAAIAIAKSLFQKGASATSALAFQFASTNLVWELGLVLWVLIGWQFTLAEYVGGVVLIVLMAVLLRLFVSPRLEEQARRHAQEAQAEHHHGAGPALNWRERLAAVLWSGGISFAGVIAFIFADLIVVPIVLAYAKYYGWPFALRITLLMLVTMVIAALAVDGLFSAAGLVPSGPRPSRNDVFGSVQLDYKLVLNVLGLIIFATLLWLRGRGRGGSTLGEHAAGARARPRGDLQRRVASALSSASWRSSAGP